MIKTNPLSVKDIEELASNLRKEAEIKEDFAFPILDYINELSEKGFLTIQILENDDPYLEENVPAKYNTVDNFIYIKEQVLDDLDNNIYWSNFTLAHELFHYLQSRVLNFEFEDVEECKTYEDPEWQANNFAGELLVPKKYLDLDEEELIHRFKVTMECVLTRKLKTKRRKNN